METNAEGRERRTRTLLTSGVVAAGAASALQFVVFDCNADVLFTWMTGALVIICPPAAVWLLLRPGWVGKLAALGAVALAGVAAIVNFASHICS